MNQTKSKTVDTRIFMIQNVYYNYMSDIISLITEHLKCSVVRLNNGFDTGNIEYSLSLKIRKTEFKKQYSKLNSDTLNTALINSFVHFKEFLLEDPSTEERIRKRVAEIDMKEYVNRYCSIIMLRDEIVSLNL